MHVPRAARWRHTVRCLGLSLGALILALAGLEGALRLLDLRPPALPTVLGRDHRRPVAGPLGWELVPGHSGRTTYQAWASGVEREVVVRVNSRGWRGPEPLPEAARNGLRIACTGDSFTFGTGVQEDQTFPAQLAAYLQERVPGPVEVFNWGVEGYGTRQEALQVAERLPTWKPDVLVLAYFLNDASHPDAPAVAPLGPLRRFVLARCAPGAFAPTTWLREHSWAATWAFQRLSLALLEGRQALMEDACYDESNPGWSDVRDGLRSVRDLCRAQGCELLVALYPRLGRRGDGLVSDGAYAQVARFCAEEGIEAFDLSPLFVDLPVEDMWVHPLDQHPDARAHALVAGALAERFEALGWLGLRGVQARR